ncbi:MAG: carboxy terminal-processing peptidase, partial [Lactococcus garvieae]
PHTSYMVPSTAAQFNIEMTQSLEGIGATLSNEGDYVVIRDIVAGGPLYKSGKASKNDYIVAVAQNEDGEFQDIIGWITDDAVKIIRGKKGTIVRLKLLAADAPAGSEPRVVRIVREKIKLEESVATSKIMNIKNEKRNYKLGVIDIPMFYRDFEYARQGTDFQSTTKDVKRFLEDFRKNGVEGVLIDLRNNGGGSLVEAINLTGLFINEGPVVQRKTYMGNIDVEHDNDASISWSGPLMLLQNRFSASASEIFAGAIQDYRRGVVVGENSYGKGTVQQLIDLDQHLNSPRSASTGNRASIGFETKEKYGQLKLTTEKFYRITGNSTQRKGVIPDIHLLSTVVDEESGESLYPTALPYDIIDKSRFNISDSLTISERNISKLNSKYQSRLKTDPILKEISDDLSSYKSDKDVKEISLNYQVRLKRKQEMEGGRKSIKKLAKINLVDKKEPVSEDEESETNTGTLKEKDMDIHMSESQKMLCDLIRIKGE